MEDTIINIIQTVGLPIGLVIYYLIFERPRQEKNAEAERVRFDTLVDKLIIGQKECAEKMESALDEHNQYIKRLITIFDKK